MPRILSKVTPIFSAVLLLAALVVQGPALSAAAAAERISSRTFVPSASPSPGVNSATARLADAGKMLPAGWQGSADRLMTVQGDASGLHVLVADEASGYQWRTVATLGDAGVETSLWIGQACLSGNGQYATVVYAPREVTNMAGAMGVLGRAAVVNLNTGAVRQLGLGYSVAYFDPGCGTGDQAVLTRGGWGGDTPSLPASTQLQLINLAAGTTALSVTVPGQATSAIPYGGAIAAAYGKGVSELSSGGRARLLAATTSSPFRLTPDASGGLGFETLSGKTVVLQRFAAGRTFRVGSAPLGSVQLTGQGGRIWVTGSGATSVPKLPAGWHAVDVPAGSLVSTTGALAVTSKASTSLPDPKSQQPGEPLPVRIQGQLLTGSRDHVTFTIPAAESPAPLSEGSGSRQRTALTADLQPATAGSPSTPVSADRTCAIAIDSPSIQAYQPDFSQVEWAADEAVLGDLKDTRPAGLYGSSLPSYTPQGLFSLPSLTGGGSIPAQVLLGVLTQESNLEQASVHVIQGQTSNPLTSYNWYGTWDNDANPPIDTDIIDWANADCGYGIGQITTGMCIAKGTNNDPQCEYANPMNATDQLAVAVDYQANIAAAAKVLAGYWNQLQGDKITMNAGVTNSADYIENWYMALWAYNSGLEPATSQYGNTTGCIPGPSCTDGNPANGGDWGLGYADNPANPAYPPDRPVFPDSGTDPAPNGNTYSPSWDMSNPQYWTYQEKVISWAFDSVTLYDYNQGKDVQAFAYAHGSPAYPPTSDFCTSDNDCNVSVLNTSSPTASDPCELTGTYLDHCWWHWPVTWSEECTSAAGECGTSVLTYNAGSAQPADPVIASEFAEDCTLGGLPSDAVIVGADEAAMGCPGQGWKAAGSMTWNFAEASNGTYPSKIDFDQIGAGFGGHFWFGYTIPNDGSSLTSVSPRAGYTDLKITGTWPAPSSVSGWTEIYVHIPSYGAWDPQANYQINPGGGQSTQHRIVNQAWQKNTWIPLGIFDLKSGASVSLSNVTYSGLGRDVAWNAAAFVPSSPLSNSYVAMGDSYSSGEGLSPYDPNSAYSYDPDGVASDTLTDSCHRSGSAGAGQAYANLIGIPGQSKTFFQEASQPGSGVQASFIACSGEYSSEMDEAALDSVSKGGTSSFGKVPQAPMTNTYWGGPTSGNLISLAYNEIPQVDDGVLNAQTTLVTITAGGDDVRFGPIMQTCVEDTVKGGNCLTSDLSINGVSDPKALDTYEPSVIEALEPHLQQLYADIAKLAPDAMIVVLGYPLLFDGGTDASGCEDAALPGSVTSWMNSMGDLLNQQISKAADYVEVQDGDDVDFVDPNNPDGNGTDPFTGHRVCNPSTGDPPADPYINPIADQGSFHPTAAGQQEFATLLNDCVKGLLSSCTPNPFTGDSKPSSPSMGRFHLRE
jgi:hypothetical protein